MFIRLTLFLLFLGTPAWAQGSFSPETVDRRIEPLSAIDQQFMAAQRADVEAWANRLGHNSRDSQTGISSRCSASWTVWSPRMTVCNCKPSGWSWATCSRRSLTWIGWSTGIAGRSRALRYRESETFLFPVTMISRRWEAGHERAVEDIYQSNLERTLAKLPGANWR